MLGDAQVRRTAPKRRLVIGLALFLPGVWFGGSFWFGGESETGGLAAYGGILMTMAMFAGMAAAAPFIILPVIRWLAVPVRRLLPTGGRLAADSLLQPAPHPATAVALTIGLSVVVVNSSMSSSFIGDHQRSDRQGLRARLHRPGTGLHDRAGRRAGRAALGPDGHRGDARDRHGRADEGDAARPPRRESGSKLGIATGVDPARQPEVDGTEFQGVSRSEAYAQLAQGGVLLGSTYANRATSSAATPSTSSARPGSGARR